MSESRLAIGLDFGATTLKIGVVYQSHVIDRFPPLPTKEFETSEELIDAMVLAVGELTERHPGVAAIGAGVPGFVDYDRGLIHSLPNVPDWDRIFLGRILEQRTGLPTMVDNRANCMAIAEWKCGAARGLKDVVFVKLETGVGGAVIANGQLIRGARNLAGEVGQTSVDWQGRAGSFGNIGAVEQYLGLAQIAEDAREAYAKAGIEKSTGECSLQALTSAARKGDPIAAAQWNRLSKMLASVVVNCCWLLNPEAVVIGGSIANAGELLFNPLREFIFSQLSDPFRDHLMVLPALFGNESGTIGAAALALDGAAVGV